MVGRGIEDPAEMLRMVRLLAEIGYRELASDANAQRLSVARRLSRDGLDERILRLLWEYAKSCDKQGSPAKLFAWWMNLPSRVHAKVAEMRTKNVWLRQTLDAIGKADAEQEKAGDIYDFKERRKVQ